MEKASFSAQLIAFFAGFSGPMAYLTVLGVLLISGLGVPIPEDITLISAGILAGLGRISLTGALIAGFIGVMIGDTFLYYLGRYYGVRVFELPVFRRVFNRERIEKAEEIIKKNQRFICFVARFLPGVRSPVFLTCGIMGVSPWVFFGLDGFAALISVPVWVVGGWYFAKNIDEALAFAGDMHKIIIGILVMAAIYIVFKWRKHKKPSQEITDPK